MRSVPLVRRQVAGTCIDTLLFSDGPAIVDGSAGSDPILDFAHSAAWGLAREAKRLESRFLYDDQGSLLFDDITRQPEYYLTAAETEILAREAETIRSLTGPVVIIELGSGSSVKTDHLLRAWKKEAGVVTYIPVDISMGALRGVCASIPSRHPDVKVLCLHGEYCEAFPYFSGLSPALVLFLGSSIGNFERGEIDGFLAELAASMSPGDFLLTGIDLVKDREVLEAAYNDAAGVTDRFTRNLFVRMNRELGSRVNVTAVQHVARYDPEKEHVEVCARFGSSQTIRIAPLGKSFHIAKGESVRTEVCCKFRIDPFIAMAGRNGFVPVEVFTDRRHWFALVLLRRTGRKPEEFSL